MKWMLMLCLPAIMLLSFTFASKPLAKPVELKVSVLSYSAENEGSVVVRFENLTDKPLQLLRPRDGSEWGWHMPIYDVSMTDALGRPVPLEPRCLHSGFYSDLTWPDDYRIQIKPGDAHEMAVHTARALSMGGRFMVTFRYIYDTTTKTYKDDSAVQFPNDLWVGTAASASIEIEVPPRL